MVPFFHTSKWRWGPVEKPSLPTSAIFWPAMILSPFLTRTPPADMCPYMVTVPSSAWICTQLPYPEAGPASITTPSVTAWMGVPRGAARSMPPWNEPQRFAYVEVKVYAPAGMGAANRGMRAASSCACAASASSWPTASCSVKVSMLAGAGAAAIPAARLSSVLIGFTTGVGAADLVGSAAGCAN